MSNPKTIIYYVCGTIPDEESRKAEEFYYTNLIENRKRFKKINPNTEFKYKCFSFWKEQLKGVVGMCNFNLFLPNKITARIKKPLKTRSITEKALNALSFTRKKRPQIIENSIANINTTHQSREFKELLDEIIGDLRDGNHVKLYGFSYGGAVLNAFARKIHTEIERLRQVKENTEFLNIFENLMIFTFGSTYVYKYKKVSNVKIYNIMILGDFATSCNNLMPPKELPKISRIHENGQTIREIDVNRYTIKDGVEKFFYIKKSDEKYSNLYWIFPEFSDHEKNENYDDLNKVLYPNSNLFTFIPHKISQCVGSTCNIDFRWDLHLSYGNIIDLLLESSKIDIITGVPHEPITEAIYPTMVSSISANAIPEEKPAATPEVIPAENPAETISVLNTQRSRSNKSTQSDRSTGSKRRDNNITQIRRSQSYGTIRTTNVKPTIRRTRSARSNESNRSK
jgi:hypothetical protein